jgi:hypothetical protein
MSKFCLSLLLGFLGAAWFFLGDAHAADERGVRPCFLLEMQQPEIACDE